MLVFLFIHLLGYLIGSASFLSLRAFISSRIRRGTAPRPAHVGQPRAGTLVTLVAEYRASADYRQLSPASRQAYGSYIKLIEDEFGDMPLQALPRPARLGRGAARARRRAVPQIATLTTTASRTSRRSSTPTTWAGTSRSPRSRCKSSKGEQNCKLSCKPAAVRRVTSGQKPLNGLVVLAVTTKPVSVLSRGNRVLWSEKQGSESRWAENTRSDKHLPKIQSI